MDKIERGTTPDTRSGALEGCVLYPQRNARP
jgi:hypothetical protein